MLSQLTIRNFAIVEQLDIELQSGLSVITGETGAGKSIAIDALSLVLGGRAESNMVRVGSEKAEITASCHIQQQSHIQYWLKEHELEQQDECILRRVIHINGRSRAFINGIPVPLQQLKELGQLLVSIHGQHDHHRLLKNTHQLHLLDAFAGHQSLCSTVKKAYQALSSAQQQYQQAQIQQAQSKAKEELLQYQIEELNQFSPQTDEYATLEEEHRLHAHSAQLVESSGQVLHQLSESDQGNCLEQVRHLMQMLNESCHIDSALTSAHELLNQAYIQLEEASFELRQYQDQLQLDPQRFTELEARLSLWLSLSRKHQVLPEELSVHWHALLTQLEDFEAHEIQLEALQQRVQSCQTNYEKAALKLSKSRQRFAKKLAVKVTEHLAPLNMPHAKFSVEISSQSSPSSDGIDQVEYLISTNPGQPLQPLYKVASGGELSRVGLVIQVITTNQYTTPTLIFDEVDVGISGPTATTVGKLLRELGQNTQVLCVTHLPQVAGQGHYHYFVDKHSQRNTTHTSMQRLDKEGRRQELARLLGSDKITQTALANADELLAA